MKREKRLSRLRGESVVEEEEGEEDHGLRDYSADAFTVVWGRRARG